MSTKRAPQSTDPLKHPSLRTPAAVCTPLTAQTRTECKAALAGDPLAVDSCVFDVLASGAHLCKLQCKLEFHVLHVLAAHRVGHQNHNLSSVHHHVAWCTPRRPVPGQCQHRRLPVPDQRVE